MKKIIYSLVIMIAASSLFTSCIKTDVEPASLDDMRAAKAEYLRALADLRRADAELQKAHAAYVLADAALRTADAAYRAAQVEAQDIENQIRALQIDMQKARNEEERAQIEARIANLEKEQEIRAIQYEKTKTDAEKALAQAEEDLRVALRNIAAQAYTLTSGEVLALKNASDLYLKALGEYNEKAQALRAAEKTLWEAENLVTGAQTEEFWADSLAMAEFHLGLTQLAVAQFSNLDFSEQNALAAEIKRYQDSVEHYEYLQKQLDIDGSRLLNEHEVCEQLLAFQESVIAALKNLPAEAEAAKYKALKKAYAYGVNTEGNDVIKKFKQYLQIYYPETDGSADYNNKSTAADKFRPFIKITETGLTVDATEADLAYILGGDETMVVSQGTDSLKKSNTVGGIGGILEALEKDFVLGGNAAFLASDIEGQKEAVAEAKKAYNDNLAIINAGKNISDQKKALQSDLGNAIDALVEAWEDFAIGVGGYNRASRADSVSLFNAIVGLAKARVAYFGPQADVDTLVYWDNFGGENKVALTDLRFDYFVQRLISSTPLYRSNYGGQSPYTTVGGALNNVPTDVNENCAFIRVMKTLIGIHGTGSLDYGRTIHRTGVDDTNNFSIIRNEGSADWDIACHYKTVPTTITYSYDSATKNHNFGGAFKTVPEVNYEKALCAFWGLTYPGDVEKAKTYVVEDYYAANTFDDIVDYSFAGQLYWNEQLNIVLTELAETGDANYNKLSNGFDANGFYKGAIKNHFFKSQLFDIYKAESKLAIMENRDSNEDAFDALGIIVLEMAAEYVEIAVANAEADAKYAADKKAYDAAIKEFGGASAITEANKIKGAANVYALQTLVRPNIQNGNKYTGALKNIANDVLKKLIEEFAKYNDKTAEYTHIKTHFKTLYEHLDGLFEDLVTIKTKQFPYDVYDPATDTWKREYIDLSAAEIIAYVEAFDAKVEEIMALLVDQQEDAAEAVEKAKYNLAQFQAGFDGATLAIKYAEESVAMAEAELEIAAQKLAAAKAQFDAIVAAYGTIAE